MLVVAGTELQYDTALVASRPTWKSSWNRALECDCLVCYSICCPLGISLAVGRLTLDQLGQVRILDPQPNIARRTEDQVY